MKRYIFILALISCSCFSSERDSDFVFSSGIGHQYGGIIGAQFAYRFEQSKIYSSIGIVGLALGFETAFDNNKKHSFGLVVGTELLRTEDGFAFVTYNYHFNGIDQKGFVIGTGIGATREDENSIINTGNREYSTALTFNLGYKF
jgi:hypothetical protein